MEFINPPDWKRPSGFANGVIAEGKLFFVAGQVGWDDEQNIVSDDFGEQSSQALRNIAAVLEAGGAKPEHVVRMTWYVTDKQIYNAATEAVGAAYREVFATHYPAMTLVEVTDLLEDGALVEIEATAVIPNEYQLR